MQKYRLIWVQKISEISWSAAQPEGKPLQLVQLLQELWILQF